MKRPVIKLVSLTKKFGKKIVLEDINLEIYSGEVFGIIGLSGTGKTTFLNLLVGYLSPTSGDVFFKKDANIDYTDEYFSSVIDKRKDVKSSFGFSSQEASFYGKLTVIENLRYFGSLYGLNGKTVNKNADKLLKLVELSESRNVLGDNLSGGMRKRLDIACALIHDPRILILDEPTSDLDPLLRKQMWDLIKNINKMGTTIILSSHFLDEIELLCDRVAILYHKEIGYVGTTEEIKDKFAKCVEIKLVTANFKYKEIIEQFEKDKNMDLLEEYKIEENLLYIKTSKTEDTLRAILKYIPKVQDKIIELEVDRPSLKEALEKIVSKTGERQ